VAEAGGGAGGPSSHRGRRVNGAVVAEISVEVRVPVCQRAVRRGGSSEFYTYRAGQGRSSGRTDNRRQRGHRCSRGWVRHWRIGTRSRAGGGRGGHREEDTKRMLGEGCALPLSRNR
jgi:hypothetical protein